MLKPVVELNSSDVKTMLKKLNEIEPKGAAKFRQALRKIADPIVKQIKANIPETPPLSGMGHVIVRTSKKTNATTTVINRGRLNWDGANTHEPAGKGMKYGSKSVSFSSGIKPTGNSLTTAIAKVIISSPAIAMTDMAGRASKGAAGGKSRSYTYRKRNGEIVRRRHRLNGQGQNMIEVLQARLGRASRFGWRGLESQIDDVSKEIDKLLQETLEKIFGRN